MRIALDTNGLYTGQAGIARYIRGLIKGLRQLNLSHVEFWECAWKVENFGYRQPDRAFKTIYRELVWARLVAPRLLSRSGSDLLHVTGSFIAEPPKGLKCVVTLHDLAVLRHPERFRRWQRVAEKMRVRRLGRADRVICVSRFTADEAMELLGLPGHRIEVVHHGCDFHPEEEVAEQPPDFPLPGEFFLFVGSLEPGKNLALIRDVYRLAIDRGIHLPPLVIVGVRWLGVGSEGQAPADWHYVGRQPDSVLVHLYRRAVALVFPSKYEGFGFPVAEAMSLGCPVICSPVASLPEVGGEAALYVEGDASRYLEAMQRVHNDPVYRAELAAKGRGQARQFTWRRCAERVAEVYSRTVAE
jgi:alpha-1,3-rhamnosyl/mannosyltransferase